ncbi:MAG: hypothetical protein LKE52_03015 [Bacilli bacterium]|jgi:hypothetical protein|nr:hypothetical protein [Bacilli bacterium]
MKKFLMLPLLFPTLLLSSCVNGSSSDITTTYQGVKEEAVVENEESITVRYFVADIRNISETKEWNVDIADFYAEDTVSKTTYPGLKLIDDRESISKEVFVDGVSQGMKKETKLTYTNAKVVPTLTELTMEVILGFDNFNDSFDFYYQKKAIGTYTPGK